MEWSGRSFGAADPKIIHKVWAPHANILSRVNSNDIPPATCFTQQVALFFNDE